MSGIKRAAIAAAVGLGAMMAGDAAWAQLASNPNAPIDISADEMEVIKAQCKSVWRGDAEALQDRRRLRARSITAYATKKGDDCGDTNRLEAEGDVYFVTPEQVIRGDHAVYNQSSDTVVVTGNVIVVQGKNVARGDRLTVRVSTGAVQMESSAKGRGNGNRVRGVFYPGSGGPL